MQNYNLKFKVCLLILIAVPGGVFAKETIGDYVLEFDQKIEVDTDGNGTNDRTSYYKGDILVWTAYDNDGDGEPDLWLKYKNGDTIDLEISDPDGDGEPDKITEFNAQEKPEIIYDSEAEFADGGSSYVTYILIAIALAAASVRYYLKVKNNK